MRVLQSGYFWHLGTFIPILASAGLDSWLSPGLETRPCMARPGLIAGRTLVLPTNGGHVGYGDCYDPSRLPHCVLQLPTSLCPSCSQQEGCYIESLRAFPVLLMIQGKCLCPFLGQASLHISWARPSSSARLHCPVPCASPHLFSSSSFSLKDLSHTQKPIKLTA